MQLPYMSSWYETWIPFLARVIFGAQFLIGAWFKAPWTPGFAAQVSMTAAAGVPIANVAVFLAFVLEVVAGIMLIVGYHARLAAFLLAGFTAILTFVFYRHVVDPMSLGMLVSHLSFIAGLLYVSVYGAKSMALKRD